MNWVKKQLLAVVLQNQCFYKFLEIPRKKPGDYLFAKSLQL